jgi:AcrR family transcriptional regulator
MPATGKTKKKVVSAFRCGEILGSARKVFAKKGFAGATMDEIAAASGLAKGTLYLYFKSKRDVYLKTLQCGSADVLEQAKTNMQANEGLRDKIRSFVATRVKYAEENRDFYKIYLAEFGNVIHPASIDKEFRDLHLKQSQALGQALRDGMDRGEIRQVDADAVAFTIQDMSRGLIARRLLGWSKKNAEEDIDCLCDLIWRGIG